MPLKNQQHELEVIKMFSSSENVWSLWVKLKKKAAEMHFNYNDEK